jgi:signal peptidase II
MLDPVVAEPTPAPPAPSGNQPSSGDGLRGRLRGRWKNDLLFFGIALSILALDQFTKILVRQNLELYETWPTDSDAFIRIIHVVNSGAAFGILQGQTSFLIITSLIGLVAIILYYVYPPMDHGLIRVALGMQLGGALGNLLDRVRFGEVTDFVDVGRFPTFNVADASISISIVAIIIFFVQQEWEARDDGAASKQQADARPGVNDD